MEFVAIREGVSPEFVRDEIARGPGDSPGQHQSSRVRTDGHRPEVPRQDQRQHRQLRRHLHHRRRSREDDLGDPLGRGHRHGSLDRPQHPRDAGVDPAELPGADRDGPDLPGARESRREGRGADLGDLPRDSDRTGRAGRGLLHDPCGRAPALRAADGEARHGHRLARRLDHGEVVPRASPGVVPLHALRGDLRAPRPLRRVLLAGRRIAAGLDGGRERRGAVRGARDARRAHEDGLGARLPGHDRGPRPRAQCI